MINSLEDSTNELLSLSNENKINQNSLTTQYDDDNSLNDYNQNKKSTKKLKSKPSGLGKLFLGIFLGILLTFATLFGIGCFAYYKGSIKWLNSFGLNISSGSEKLDNMTIEDILNSTIKIYNNYDNITLQDIAAEFGYELPDVIYGIDITDITSVKISELSTAIQNKLNTISAYELEEFVDFSSIDSILNSYKDFYYYNGKIYEDSNLISKVDFSYTISEDASTLTIKGQTYSINSGVVSIQVKYLPLSYVLNDIENYTLADLLGYTIDANGTITDQQGNEITGILKLLANYQIGELTSAINNLTLTDVIGEIDENSIFSLIDYSSLTLSEIPDALASAIQDATISTLYQKGLLNIEEDDYNQLGDTIKSMTISQIIKAYISSITETIR